MLVVLRVSTIRERNGYLDGGAGRERERGYIGKGCLKRRTSGYRIREREANKKVERETKEKGENDWFRFMAYRPL